MENPKQPIQFTFLYPQSAMSHCTVTLYYVILLLQQQTNQAMVSVELYHDLSSLEVCLYVYNTCKVSTLKEVCLYCMYNALLS